MSALRPLSAAGRRGYARSEYFLDDPYLAIRSGPRVATVRAATPSHNRFGSLGHDVATRHLHFRVVAHQKCDRACHDGTGCQQHKTERRFAGRILDPTDGIRADKAAEIADRIDQCNAAGGGGAREKAGREGPKRGIGRIYSHRMVRVTAARTGLLPR